MIFGEEFLENFDGFGTDNFLLLMRSIKRAEAGLC